MDISGPVEYHFDETSGNPGGTDSGWQTSPWYTDSGLDASTQYTYYTVQMRVSLSNTGTASSPASATTDAKSGCGAAPMYNNGALANVPANLFIRTCVTAIGTLASFTGYLASNTS